MGRASRCLIVALGVLAISSCSKEREAARDGGPAAAAEQEAPFQPNAVAEARARPPMVVPVNLPKMNARRGRILFATKGCVICHQANGVGGTAAPRLDAAAEGQISVNPLEFSARMWRGAAAMTALQETELGYVIELDAQDIADLAAFAASPEEQSLLTLDSVPEPLRDWFINAPYWQGGEWSEYRSRGERLPDIEEPPQ